MKLQPGDTYTRKQITELFGGLGPGVLPAKDGKVVCGLFDLGINAVTHLSGEIDVYLKTLPKAAVEGAEIPVFLKISTQLWRYAGSFRLVEALSSKKDIEKARKELGREDIGAVLRFEPTGPALKLVKGSK